MGLRIALLNAAHDATETRRNFDREIAADLDEYDVVAGEYPDCQRYDACIVTGSRASVYWDEPWIAELREWTASAVERGLPFLGVCFGHQLLADALGGSVEPMDEYEIGYRTVEHDGDAPLFDGVAETFTVFTSHSDTVAALPAGARRIAENDYGVHGFRKGDVFGVQFHPEYDRAMAERVASSKDELPAARRERVLEGIDRENYLAAREATTVFDNFLSYVRARPSTEDATASNADAAAHGAADD
ncbi:type 1 glutamine amidotransferase [Natronomonas salina]|uniref:type 1 glutamine amidotransferase n=1 Tax=Natronomonas salina TaxID=1710540 RepID=UPI0015B6C14C|nr:type 1 glutamine amidotransferase [Natronomonas salina]QLD91043.1 type 1 glutamine amidotransferase [Natronomonas salina]